MRYPREIFAGKWALPMGWFFTFVIPILLVVNVPARYVVFDDPRLLGFTAFSTLVLLVVSRKFFRYALRRYRSASS
jgi:ABC-2 type transport system permease protein